MSFDMKCTSCGRSLRAPDRFQGKQFKCPHCKAIITATAAEPKRWSMRAADGQIFGPVDKEEMDDWVAEGRMTAESQLLSEGSEKWLLAKDVYPSLATALPPDAPASLAPVDTEEAPAFTPAAEPSTMNANSDPSPSFRPAFHPRRYPILQFVMYSFYGLAILVAFSLVLSLISVLSGVGEGSDGMLVAILLLTSIMFHGAGIVALVFAAELVKIIIDIQGNTQETAHYTKQNSS